MTAPLTTMPMGPTDWFIRSLPFHERTPGPLEGVIEYLRSGDPKDLRRALADPVLSIHPNPKDPSSFIVRLRYKGAPEGLDWAYVKVHPDQLAVLLALSAFKPEKLRVNRNGSFQDPKSLLYLRIGEVHATRILLAMPPMVKARCRGHDRLDLRPSNWEPVVVHGDPKEEEVRGPAWRDRKEATEAALEWMQARHFITVRGHRMPYAKFDITAEDYAEIIDKAFARLDASPAMKAMLEDVAEADRERAIRREKEAERERLRRRRRVLHD